MGELRNSDAVDKLIKDSGIQTSVDVVPKNINQSIQPTLQVNPNDNPNLLKGLVKTTTGAGVIYTTPEDKDFYLHSACLAYSADAACDCTNYSIQVQPKNGAAANLLQLRKETTTAGNGVVTISLSNPILLKRYSNIILAGTFAAGTTTFSGDIVGFIRDLKD